MKEDVNNHFLNFTVGQIQLIHIQSPTKVSLSTNESRRNTHLTKLSGYIEERIANFEPAERNGFARADLTYTTPTGEVEPVLAFRYENVTKPISFSKKEFVNSVVFGKMGQSNRRKQIGQSRDKCTLVYLKCLGEELQQKVKTEFPGNLTHTPPLLPPAPPTMESRPPQRSQPSTYQPVPAVVTQPSTSQPVPAVVTQPSTSQPVPAVVTQPSTSQPVPAVVTQPSTSQPVAQPSTTQPVPAVVTQPSTSQPVNQPSTTQPIPAVVTQPSTSQPVTQPSTTQPVPAVVTQPSTSQPVPDVVIQPSTAHSTQVVISRPSQPTTPLSFTSQVEVPLPTTKQVTRKRHSLNDGLSEYYYIQSAKRVRKKRDIN